MNWNLVRRSCRHFATIPVAAVVVAAVAGQARGAVLFSDSFTYPDGNLVGGGGTWVNVSVQNAPAAGVAWAPVKVTGGATSLVPGDGVATAAQWAEAPLSSTITAASADKTVYYAADVTLTAAGTGDYFMALRNSGTSKSYAAQLWAKADPSDATKYLLGITVASSGLQYGTVGLTLGETYRIVAKYTFNSGSNNDLAAIYVVPTDAANEANNTPYAVAGASTGDSSGIAEMVLRPGTNPAAGGVASPTVTIDNVVVATDFTSAVGSVPEPTGVSVAGLVSVAMLVRHRRRRPE